MKYVLMHVPYLQFLLNSHQQQQWRKSKNVFPTPHSFPTWNANV